jgi:hypothetical protein
VKTKTKVQRLQQKKRQNRNPLRNQRQLK